MIVATITGNLTKDPEMININTKSKPEFMAVFTVASNQNKDDVIFCECSAFGRQAEIVEEYYKKGSKVTIVAQGRDGTYKNKEGVDVNKISWTVLRLELPPK